MNAKQKAFNEEFGRIACSPRARLEDVRSALCLVLDHVDYTSGACTITEKVGAVLPITVIKIARGALKL